MTTSAAAQTAADSEPPGPSRSDLLSPVRVPEGSRDGSLDESRRLRILLADTIALEGVEILRRQSEVEVATGLSEDELRERIGEHEILIVRSATRVTESLLLAAPRLQVIGRAGAGVDNIDVEAATRRGILVINAPSGNTIAAAEHAVAMMLALMRNIPRAHASMRSGGWDRSTFTGHEAREKTLGVLGLGRIGFEVARIANRGLGMHVLASDPVVPAERAAAAGAELVDLDSLLRLADVVTVHVPLIEKTKGLLGRSELAALKPGAFLVNVARGGIVDEAALVDALRSGHVAGAALDVYAREPLPAEHPLRHLEQVVLTPHLGASTEEAQINVSVDLAQQILLYLDGELPPSAVNGPALPPGEMPRLRPYLELALKIGRLSAQLCGGRVRRVTCAYSRAAAGSGVDYLTAEILRGIFSDFTETRMSAVNARLVARDHGVTVEDRIAEDAHGPSLSVEIDSAEHVIVGGDIVAGEGRIKRVKDFVLDLQPSGDFLVVEHTDRPGVLARVAGLLADSNINIGRVELGRDRPRGRALMLMQVDDPVDPALLEAIQRAPGLESARLVRL